VGFEKYGAWSPVETKKFWLATSFSLDVQELAFES
jgi:hypothetical protein